MRFTPALFVSAVAASYYQAAPVSSSTPAAADHGYGGKASSTAAVSSSSPAGGYGGSWPKASSSSVVSSKKGGPKKWKTTTSYETECYTVTSSSSTKVWTSVKAIPTVCEDDDDEDSWVKTSAKSTPYSPVKPTASTPYSPVKPTGGANVPYCSAVTETCTVTVTAAAGSDYTPGPKPNTPAAPVVPTSPASPVVPVAPVYSASTADSWGAYPKPSGTGSYTKPKAPEFTGAASIQKAGALLAGAGAVAAMLL